MLDAGAIASGIITGLATQKGVEAVNSATKTGLSHEEKVELLLASILESLAQKEQYNHNRSMALQAYPSEYMVAEDWFGYPHICIFFHDETPIRFDIEGVGTYLKTVGPGWVQCDVRGRISTTDSQNHNVIISYRGDALGAAL